MHVCSIYMYIPAHACMVKCMYCMSTMHIRVYVYTLLDRIKELQCMPVVFCRAMEYHGLNITSMLQAAR